MSASSASTMRKACRDGYSALYMRSAALFRDLALARADGSLRNMLLRLSKIDVLVVDDWAMMPLTEPEARDFWEMRGPLSDEVADSDFADAGGEMAQPDRRLDRGRGYPRPHRSSGASV